MNRKIVILLLALSLAGSVCFSSCEKYILPSLSFATDTLSVSAAAQTVPQTVVTNVDWSLYSNSNWASSDLTEGSGETAITVSVLENTDAESRRCSITVETETLKKTFLIIQQGSPE